MMVYVIDNYFSSSFSDCFSLLETWVTPLPFLYDLSSLGLLSSYLLLSWWENLDNFPFLIKSLMASFFNRHSSILWLLHIWKQMYRDLLFLRNYCICFVALTFSTLNRGFMLYRRITLSRYVYVGVITVP